MTPIQQTYLAKLRATADANLAFFEKNLPALHRVLVRTALEATVDISDQGDVTIRYPDGSSLPATADIMEMETKLVRFANLADRPQILAFHQLREVSDEPSHGDMQRYHYSNLDAEFPNRAKRHFAEHYPDNTGLYRYPEFGGKDIPLVIVLGSGLGWHLPRLLLEYRIGHLMVIDIDDDAFRLSVFFQDYVLLSRLAMERGTTLTFMVESDLLKLSRTLMSFLRHDLPPFYIHGAAVFYAMPEDERVEEIKKTIVQSLWELFFGLGYFDDELISIRHTFDNLRQGLPIYLRPDCVRPDAVAFIVGSGPSLDGLLPILREYGDRAVIFSCGTSLSALVNAGIRPDFHVEKERPYIVYEVLTKTVGQDFLRDLRFLGLNVVHPDVFALFERKGIILKAADTVALLLAQAGAPLEIILNTQPTVTNTAIDFALSAGFRQVYLFGVDMGYKDQERHHSQHTAYLQKMPEAEHLRQLLSKRPPSDIVVPGNFDGEVRTNNILSVARQYMEHAIAMHPAAQVYNLNDGAIIRGALPLRMEEFACAATQADKSAALEAIEAAFEVRRFDLEDMARDLLAQIDRFIAEVSATLAEEMRTRADVIARITRLYLQISSGEARMAPATNLFSGTILHLTSLTFNAVTIILDEDEVVAKAQYDFSNLVDFLEEARLEVGKVLADIV